MEMPMPPDDQELRNVIDKLAQFVARNGPEFEKMTMEKQKDNPKFSFLFGGEFYSYYKCKLAALQKVVVPIYCTSFLAVEEDKQQKIARLLQLWEKNGYFDDS